MRPTAGRLSVRLAVSTTTTEGETTEGEAMNARDVSARLRDAYDRCAKAHAGPPSGFVPFLWIEDGLAEQVHHGTTDYALAAWADWCRSPRDPVWRARGVVAYLVPDLDGARTIATPAMILDTVDGLSLALTGCAWGYGGEGPHGSALVLTDAGLFADLEAAQRFVRDLDRTAAWELVRVYRPCAGPR
jgi:hypothetical protein